MRDFRPLVPESPPGGTVREQVELWMAVGVTHLVVEHGGTVHGDALDRIDALCPPGTVELLDNQTRPVSGGPQLGFSLPESRSGIGESRRAECVGAGALRPPRGSVIDGASLGGIHLFPLLSLQEHGLDLFVQELPSPWIPGIQPMVIDEDGLMLEPFCPAILADLLVDPLPSLVSKRGLLEFGSVPFCTFDSVWYPLEPWGSGRNQVVRKG